MHLPLRLSVGTVPVPMASRVPVPMPATLLALSRSCSGVPVPVPVRVAFVGAGLVSANLFLFVIGHLVGERGVHLERTLDREGAKPEDLFEVYLRPLRD